MHSTFVADRAKKLRRSMTVHERRVWWCIRDRRLGGVKFRRQYAIDCYVLDFYCDELKLAIELDGSQHATADGQRHDEARTSFLNGFGIEVVRVPNHIVRERLDDLLTWLCDVIAERRKQRL